LQVIFNRRAVSFEAGRNRDVEVKIGLKKKNDKETYRSGYHGQKRRNAVADF